MCELFNPNELSMRTEWDEDDRGFCTYVYRTQKRHRVVVHCTESAISEIESVRQAESWIEEHTHKQNAELRKKPR